MDLQAERKLWEEVRGGNKEAFRSLANSLIPKAYRTAYMMLRSKHLAEEAVQNALIELYAAIMSGRDIVRPSGWFSRLIALRSIDIARKEQSYKMNIDIDEMDIQDGSASPLDDLLRKEQSAFLLESIMDLEVNQRIVVGLYYFQEMQIDEIAELLGIKEGTVKSRLYHARLKLGGMLGRARPQTKEIPV
ncbi:RNA polymerase sigma factor [Paenibacillus ginsengarvi]|uniref:Sigma-70 family RNA polymerase sigma factor n=1 Tax=Paenibacillus ginsengarvi TaxID=400777 RepID=A0A3B0CLR9_9BACL|nr:sigma-70 family RNA polymerase sigma factor [Paenibacillus ginsengarvi]RKN85169.1 sigma-70 family RNA polymerase sigma factor [Paenibacillus ginsengarvi]